jgi:carboxymethylenebutenolidase
MNRLLPIIPAVLSLVTCVLLAPLAGAQDWAKPMLEKSPRHREYVTVTHDGRNVNTLVVYPETKGKAPVIVLIHEIFGVSDWFKLQADELAAEGYIVVAPDLTSGVGPNGGGTDALFASGGQDAVVKGVTTLPEGQVTADLDAVSDYGKKLPSANGKLFVAGFCWGGGKSFAFATHRADLSAAFVFYGPPPAAADMAKINAPIYGFYGGNDARIGATVPQAVADMKAAGKMYQPVTYEGAGHGFMRGGQAPDAKPGDKKAFDEGFARLVRELKLRSMEGKAMKMSMSSHAKRAGQHNSLNRVPVDCAVMHGAM